jgi:hypothetical protein
VGARAREREKTLSCYWKKFLGVHGELLVVETTNSGSQYRYWFAGSAGLLEALGALCM